MSRHRQRWLGGLLLGVLWLLPTAVQARPSVWARARDPQGEKQRETIRTAERLLLKSEQEEGGLSPQMAQLYLTQARLLYEMAGVKTSTDPFLRTRYAGILQELGDYEATTHELEAILRLSPPAPVRSEVYRDLAVCYARLDRHDEEIRAYGEALALEPHAGPRSLLLSNRAEAFMAIGDITQAVAGYRASLALLGTREMFSHGVTTLWGLSVGLDRSGDLESALENIRLARTYDPRDMRINGPGWFYVPSYDVHWYKALGHWQSARAAETGAARVQFFGDAVASWQAYLDSAPTEDSWAPLARVRLAQCEREREDAIRRSLKVRTSAKPPPARPRGKTP
ncbi:tetratricopeptide repeat protein [Chondromyces crocatus]|uniref:Uncharacterized protein n=1 Tax=Chondromyces crocatus TaxID=52 RepID=A0A0K1ETF1_CHOCO|nr:hypothetical protein [Chondromyces crocatus]AKT44131.1 uncharacterized protein CMC5_083710 [Chondromyces crocatus]